MNNSVSAPAVAVKAVFSGNTISGGISIPGLQAGDVLITILPSTGFMYGFEQTVSLNGELQQLTSLDWSTVTFTAYFMRGV